MKTVSLTQTSWTCMNCTEDRLCTEHLNASNERYIRKMESDYQKYLVVKGLAYITVIAVSFILGAMIY